MAIVYGYGTNPLHVLSVSELGDGRFYGIELEFSSIPDIQEVVLQKAIFKEDSSIGCAGAELVSAPMLLDQALDWVDSLDMSQWAADGRCGMHVHINRPALTERQIAIIMACIEDDYLYSFVREIAGRDFASSNYCKKSKDNNGGRYQAVNLTRRSTIEIRIFSGTNDKAVIKERLQWLNDLVDYASQPNATLSYASFMLWRGDITMDEHTKLKQSVQRLEEMKEKEAEKERRRKAREDWWYNVSLWLIDYGPLVALGLLATLTLSVAGLTTLIPEPPGQIQNVD